MIRIKHYLIQQKKMTKTNKISYKKIITEERERGREVKHLHEMPPEGYQWKWAS